MVTDAFLTSDERPSSVRSQPRCAPLGFWRPSVYSQKFGFGEFRFSAFLWKLEARRGQEVLVGETPWGAAVWRVWSKAHRRVALALERCGFRRRLRRRQVLQHSYTSHDPQFQYLICMHCCTKIVIQHLNLEHSSQKGSSLCLRKSKQHFYLLIHSLFLERSLFITSP